MGVWGWHLRRQNGETLKKPPGLIFKKYSLRGERGEGGENERENEWRERFFSQNIKKKKRGKQKNAEPSREREMEEV